MAEKISKRNKNNATLTLLVSDGDNNFVSDKTNAALMNNAVQYMAGLHETIVTYELDQKIIGQEEVIKETNKNYTKLVDEAASLDKQMKKIEKDIADNKKNIEKQQAEVDKQKQALEVLKAGKQQ